MFDINTFKKSIQVWSDKNPEANKVAFLSYCEEQIPANEYNEYSWLLDQAAMWFENRARNRNSQPNAN